MGIAGFAGLKTREFDLSNEVCLEGFIDFGGIYTKYQTNPDSNHRYIVGYSDIRSGISFKYNYKDILFSASLLYFYQMRDFARHKPEDHPPFSTDFASIFFSFGWKGISLNIEPYYYKHQKKCSWNFSLLFNFR
jgi:hypothetical protein